MRITLLVLAPLALAVPAAAHTNEEMAGYCRENLRFIENPDAFVRGPEALTAGICSGFFYNVHDFHNLMAAAPGAGPLYCLPEGATAETLIRAFLAWFERERSRAAEPFAGGFARAMRASFACE